MNKQQLANRIWESANRMRSKIEANAYKDYILGFIFYKYLSDTELRFLRENDFTDEDIHQLSEDDPETVHYIQQNIGYFIAYRDLFSTWLEMGRTFDVSNVTDALSAFSRLISATHKKVFNKIFDTLQTGLSKLGDSSGARTKAIRGLLQLIKDIPMDGKQGYDVLGFIYEYLIGMFAANAGKKAGEFYTPHEVSVLMSEIVANHLRGKREIKIYDPTSGSGSLLINIGQSVSKYVCDSDNIKYYAQELKENTYNLTRMNLVMRGIKPSNIVARNGDTLENDWPYFEENDPVNSYDPLYVDAVVSNPPYSQTWDPTGKASDPRYARFGLAPKGKADYAFLLHDLYHLKPDGIMTIVLPHGVLFRGGEEGEIRKNLIENNHIDAIIGLPANIFFGTGIPTIIMVLKQNRLNSDVLIIDASKGFIKEGKNNKLRASDIKRISDVLLRRWNVPKFSRRVPRDEIRANAYNLNIPRYVDSSEEAESWDIYASMFGGIPERELARLDAYWRAFPSLKSALFKPDRPYAKLACADIDAAVKANEDVRRFAQDYAAAMRILQDVMHERLFDTMFDLVPSQEEAVLADAMFKRLEGMPLLDRYEAYQLLDDQWTKIATDLEVIQSEGFDAVKKVDPAMVIKRKDGQDQEVQNGWTGRVIPFSLIQASLLKADHDAIRALEEDLAEKPSAYAEILESLTEDERESLKDQLTEEADAFIPAALGKKIKELKADPSGDALALCVKLEAADAIVRDEKDLKARIKSASAKLEAKTKAAIENLTYDEAIQLLQAKWIDALLENLNKLPSRIVDGFIQELQTLAAKYETTFSAIETEIEETQTKLADMIAELSGSEFDQEGLCAFQTLLRGEAHG